MDRFNEYEVDELLNYINSDQSQEKWLTIGGAFKACGGSFESFDDWSSTGSTYKKQGLKSRWDGFYSNLDNPEGYLLKCAENGGFQGKIKPKTAAEIQRNKAKREAARRKEEQQQKLDHATAAKTAQALWAASSPIKSNPYLSRKGVQPTGELRQISEEKAKSLLGEWELFIGGTPLKGDLLVVPVGDETGLTSVQLVDKQGLKKQLKGGRISGCYWSTGPIDNEVLIGEGVATALSGYEATGITTVAALSNHGVKNISEKLRNQYPDLKITILGEPCKKTGAPDLAHLKAQRATGALLAMPTVGGDLNDTHQEQGIGSVREAISNASLSQDIDDKNNHQEQQKSFDCKETAEDFYENYPSLEARREEGRRRQCEKFAFLILKSMIHRLGRSLEGIYETAQAYCEPSKELVKAIQLEVDKRDARALEPQCLTSDHYLKRDDENLLDLDEAVKITLESDQKLVGCRFDHGSNKTQGVALRVAQELGSSLWPSHREILATTTARKITSKGSIVLASYQEVQANSSFHVATCINSIARFKDQSAKALIIDEAAQVLTHFEGDAWNSEAVRKDALEVLKELARKAEKVLLLDADLTDHHMKAWREILDCKALVIDSEPSKVKRNVELIYSESPITALKEALLCIALNVKQGKKLSVACESFNAAKALQKDLEARGLKVLALHRETDNTIKEAFSADPDGYIEANQPDVMIYTSVIGSGVSLEAGYFDISVTVKGGNILTPEDDIQMMRRDRGIKDFKVFFSQTHKDKNRQKPIFEGFDTHSIDGIKLSAKKLKTHKRVYNEVIFENLLRARNFNITITHNHQKTVGTKTTEIKQLEAEEIFKAIPRDIIATNSQEHRQAQAWEIMTWLDETEKTYTPNLRDCLAYRTDKLKFKRVCQLTGSLEVDDVYKGFIEDAQILYSELNTGVDEADLSGFFERVWELKDFLTILNLLPEEWIMRKCNRWPKKRLKQAAKVLAKYWDICHEDKPEPQPISKKKAEMAEQLEQVKGFMELGMGTKRIMTETGWTRGKVQRLKRKISNCQGIENANNSQSIYKNLGDNHKNDPLANSHKTGLETEESFPVSKSVIVNLQGAAVTAQAGEIKVKAHACVVEGVKASFTHTATGAGCSEIETVFFDISDDKITTSHVEELTPCFKEITAVIDLGEQQLQIAVNDQVYLNDFLEWTIRKYGQEVQRITDIRGAEDWPDTIKLEAY